MWRATVKGMWAHKLRLAATGLAVLLGVAFVAGTLVLTDTVRRTFDDLFAAVNEGTDVFIRSGSVVEGGFGEERARLDASLVEVVAGVDGVAVAEGTTQGFAQIVGDDGDPLGGQGPPTFGIAWTDTEDLNPMVIREGRAPGAADEIVIDRGSADRGDLEVGDRTTVLTNEGPIPVTVVGIATFGTADSPGGATIALFTPEAAQRHVGEPGRYDAILVVGEEGVSEDTLRDRIVTALPDAGAVEVLTGAEITAEQQSDVREGLGFFTTFLLTFAGVALFVGSFIIHNTFSIVVAQRGRELALLRAIGASRRQVLLSVIGEALVVGFLASAGGILAGIAVAAGLKALLDGFGIDIPAGGVALLPRTVIVGFVVGMGVTLLATLLPARRASRIPPIAAMRDLSIDTSGRSRVRLLAGLAVTFGGLGVIAAGIAGEDVRTVGIGAMFVFLGVAALGPVIAAPVTRVIGWPPTRLRGVAGKLARENAMRNPRRTAATASALMIGVGLVGFITIFATSAQATIGEAIDDAFVGDFVVEPANFGTLSPSLAQEIDTVEGVATATGIRGALVEIDGDASFVSAVEPAEIEQTFDVGIVEGSAEALATPGTIALHEDEAEAEGLELGDTISVRFAETGVQQLRVAAIFTEDTFAGSHVIGFPTLEANTADQVDFTVLVTLDDSADVDATRERIEQVVAGYPGAELQDRTEFKQSQADQVNQLLNLIYALLGLAVIIGLIGIANTLALSVFERTRELGLLRAVGMTRAQLRSAVRWESVLIAVLGAVLGLFIALGFAWAIFVPLSEEGFDNFEIPFGRLTVIVLLAALAGVAAAIPPARRAARLDVLRAVTVE